jgi:hypothetical protein
MGLTAHAYEAGDLGGCLQEGGAIQIARSQGLDYGIVVLTLTEAPPSGSDCVKV